MPLRPRYLTAACVLLFLEGFSLAAPAQLTLNYADPRDSAAAEEDQFLLLRATSAETGVSPEYFTRMFGLLAGGTPDSVLVRKDATANQLLMAAFVAHAARNEKLTMELLLRARDVAQLGGPANEEIFLRACGALLSKLTGTALSTKDAMDTATKLAIAAGRLDCSKTGDVIPALQRAAILARQAGNDAVAAACANAVDQLAKKAAVLCQKGLAASDGYDSLVGPAQTLLAAGYFKLEEGNSKEAASMFQLAGDVFRKTNIPFFGEKALIGKALALDGEPEALESRKAYYAVVTNSDLPEFLDLKCNESGMGILGGLGTGDLKMLGTQTQPFALGAKYFTDGTLPDALLQWKALGSVLKRQMNRRQQSFPASWKNFLREKESQPSIMGVDPAAIAALTRRNVDADAGYSQAISKAFREAIGSSPTFADLQKALPVDGAYIDFLRFPYYEGKNQWSLHYGVLVALPNAPAQWTDLGAAIPIDELVRGFHNQMSKQDEEAFAEKLKALSARVWSPVAAKLTPSCKRIWISPDGELGAVSFACLLDTDGQFVAEKVAVAYCVNGRDLLEKQPAAEKKTAFIVGNPAYDLAMAAKSTSGKSQSVPGWSRGLEGEGFATLDGSKEESEEIALLARTSGYKVQLLEGKDATESQVKGVASPRFLHIATHGFFFRFASEDSLAERFAMPGDKSLPNFQANPSNASGIALAGINQTLKAWESGTVPDLANDGVFSAREASKLDLHATDLVTLSACETGRTHPISGVGAIGLRVALYEAGARNVLVTLWKTDDKFSEKFMRDFYARYLKGESPEKALYETQLAALLEQKKSLQTAVELAGPFVLSTVGSLVLPKAAN